MRDAILHFTVNLSLLEKLSRKALIDPSVLLLRISKREIS